jgi:16S rRNA (cytosine967-C5)-methyltransferase
MSKKNVREAALEILISIEKNQAYSNLLLNKVIEKHSFSRKDAGLLTEIVYGTIQRRDTLDFYLKPFIKKQNKLQQWVSILLRLSVYQMIYLDRVPAHAVIYEAVEIGKKRGHKGIASMVNGVLRTIQREGVPKLEDIKDPIERLALETSHPLWLVKRWVSQYGYEETKKMCKINLQPPEQTARTNSNRLSRDTLMERLKSEGFQVEKGTVSPYAVKSLKGNLAHSQAFAEGLLTIQDESSMLVADALGVEEGNQVLDCCAAPGGKTTHIAELLHNTGMVVSLDLHEHKVKLIQEQVERLSLSNVTTKVMDSRNVHLHFQEESFEKILVDAPCSGFGVIRRKPDIKYAKNEDDITNLANIQLSILNAAAPLLKKGGTLVYSTCTIDKEENEDVVNAFLQSHPDFTRDITLIERMPEPVKPFVQNGQVQILPHYFGSDGFYIASLRKQV